MNKNSILFPDLQEKEVISLPKSINGKKIKVGFDAPDLSSHGGLLLASVSNCDFIDRLSDCIPDYRNPLFIVHSLREMVRQRVGQIACGYEDANDCDALRHDSALKMMAGHLPSGNDLSSQPTMTRLENRVGIRALYEIGRLFVAEFVRSFPKAPKRIILDIDDTNANTYGNQQLALFNDYYGEYCYMPTLLYDGLTGKMILPILRPGRRNKSANTFGILRRVVEYLHRCWPRTIIELRGDSHFCSHEFKDMKFLRADRMSCSKFRANQFRLFLYAAAYMLIHRIKHTVFKNTPIEDFTTASFIQRIMLSAVLMKEGKGYIRISFVKGHRYRAEMLQALHRITA